MKQHRAFPVLLLALALCIVAIAGAQFSEHYDLTWNALGGGGGGAMGSSSYMMSGTVGQIIGLSGSSTYQLGAGYEYGYMHAPAQTPTAKFDTGSGTYPSIPGIHNGTITPNQTITANTLYLYPCAGTGGHTEYVKLWNSTGWNVTATWNGYSSDWHNISFDTTISLFANETYNYTIRTGSYPQIIHAPWVEATNGSGVITCTEFVDVNGKRYNNAIPAIKLW